jgi:hypothetical protein
LGVVDNRPLQSSRCSESRISEQVWWFFAQEGAAASLALGEDIVRHLRARASVGSRAVRAHLFSHRYARGAAHKETMKELNTYHSAVLLEWDHGLYTTVVELATLNGVSGRRGKSNWFHDKLEDRTALYRAMAAHMVLPWRGELAEIRCSDVEARTLDEFKAYVEKYTGPQHRFLDVHYTHSQDVRIYHNAQEDVARYLLNYMGRDRRYTEAFRNCQAFAADFYGFMCAEKDIEPFSAVLRIGYLHRSHLFLYDPAKFEAAQSDADESAAV